MMIREKVRSFLHIIAQRLRGIADWIDPPAKWEVDDGYHFPQGVHQGGSAIER